jgi:hypothetical protein
MGRTLQEAIDEGLRIDAWCHARGCHHHSEIDLVALAARLGPEHGSMHDDLVPKLRCTKCGGKAVGLIVSPGGNFGRVPRGSANG